jgi:hypothetical protein
MNAAIGRDLHEGGHLVLVVVLLLDDAFAMLVAQEKFDVWLARDSCIKHKKIIESQVKYASIGEVFSSENASEFRHRTLLALCKKCTLSCQHSALLHNTTLC